MVGFETNLGNNAKPKEEKYKNLETNLKSKYKKVKFINIVISTLGVFDRSFADFLEMLEDVKFDQTCRHHVVKKIMATAVRTSYCVFCRRNKDWVNPELMTFETSHFSNGYLFFFFILLVCFCSSSQL